VPKTAVSSLLVQPFAAARPRLDRPISLVVWGGHRGECEGGLGRSGPAQAGAVSITLVVCWTTASMKP
jgi:hypothetical protein